MSIRSPRSAAANSRRGASQGADALADVHILSAEEAWALYDSQARKFLGMSADEFDERWESGQYANRLEETSVRRVAMVRTEKPGG